MIAEMKSRDVEDSLQEMPGFYHNALEDMPGWQWSENFGIFYKSDEPMTVAKLMSFTVPVIEIKELDSNETQLVSVEPAVKHKLSTLVQNTYAAD